MRAHVIPRTIALVGLTAMLAVIGVQLASLTVESGDLVLHLSYANFGIGLVTTIAAVLWTVWSPQKVGGVVVIVVSVLLNPIWLLLLIRALG